MFAKHFKQSDRVHACPAVYMPQQRRECTHQSRGDVVTDMEDSDLDDKDSVMLPLVYPEDSNNEESLRDPPSTEPTPEPGPPSRKKTK